MKARSNTSLLGRLLRLEGQKTKNLFIICSVIIILFCTLFFYTTQKVIPLALDQITNVTIIEHFQNPHLYDHDPLWGSQKLFLPLNLGVFSFYVLSWFGPIEAGIPIALTVVMLLYLIAAFFVFYKLSESATLALCLSLLSCLPVEMPASTFWGIGNDYPFLFLSRVIFLPFVPLIFYAFLSILKDPKLKKCILFYFGLGLLAFVHQISSFYLFLAFLLCLFLWYPRLLNIHGVSLASWLLPVSPLVVYVMLHYNFISYISVPPHVIQSCIEDRFAWAFYPNVAKDTLRYIIHNPFHIIILSLVPFIFWKNLRVKYLTVTVVAIIISSLGVYMIQVFLLKFFNMPFKCVDLLRGFRYIPFLAFLSVAVIWQDIVSYFRRTPLLQRITPIISVMLLVFSILIFTLSYHFTSPKSTDYTCSDPIFEVVQQLPPSVLIATNNIHSLRYCGKRSVYVIMKDGAIAYYNGTDQFLTWVKRIVFSQEFFKTLSKELLADLQKHGVTHVFVEGELPRSDLWTKVYCSPQYCLYQLKVD